MVLKKFFGGIGKPFLEISKAPTVPVDVAPVKTAPVDEPASDQIPASLDSAAPGFKIGPPLQTPVKISKELTPVPKNQAVPQNQAPPKIQAAPVVPEVEVLTTAQLLAAEKAENAANIVVISNETFADKYLNPANALPRARRLPGAALAGFKEMAEGIRR
ncbi:MAG: hypothetical protein JHD39_04445 [Synechococcus sp. SupBloom_Metag_053]|jgi:hypothetical protein|nr:hypothetical protein [Synechococcus sp. SupBloom_Metag_053]